MSAPYIPLYVADYLSDTTHLSRSEHGAYLLLLMAMWRAGGKLPADDRKLAKLTLSTPEEWAEMRETILEFFKRRGGTLTHKRLTGELAKYEDKIGKRSEAGKASASKKANKNKRNTSTNVDGLLQQNSTNQNQNQNQNHIKENISNDTFSLTGECGWEDFVREYPAERHAHASGNAWLEVIVGRGHDPAEVLRGLRWSKSVWAAEKTEKRWIPYAKNYLLDEGFLAYRSVTETPTVPEVSIVWSGPAEILAAVEAECGKGFVASYLLTSRWDPENQTITAANGFAHDKLRRVACLRDYITERSVA